MFSRNGLMGGLFASPILFMLFWVFAAILILTPIKASKYRSGSTPHADLDMQAVYTGSLPSYTAFFESEPYEWFDE